MTITQTYKSYWSFEPDVTFSYKVVEINNDTKSMIIEKVNGSRHEMQFTWFAYALKNGWIKLYI